MRTLLLAALGIAVAFAVVLVRGPAPEPAKSSSHREAPLIAESPSGDNTDLYAFRSPDKPNTLTIVSNWIPGEDPAAGPNWYTFSPSARYNIKIDRNGDAPGGTYAFRFRRPRARSSSATRAARSRSRGTAGSDAKRKHAAEQHRSAAARLPRLSYSDSGSSSAGRRKVFAGQRDDAFFGDIGAIFDLLGFRKAGTTATRAAARTSSPATTSTPSRCRSRSPSSTTRSTRSASGRPPTDGTSRWRASSTAAGRRCPASATR